ncbi:MAG: hypothetical protein H6657_20715 [Ardenticatenaceae bacterium]|nr:hypothetical protein [Anaerolineales bacterium]MCB8979840.1 hypothetical protein [Ardenticatenaceae bacterium]
MTKFSLKQTIVFLGLFVIVMGMAVVIYQRATASPTGSNDIYLPLTTKPGTPPPQIAGCDIFPGDNIWNTPVDKLPVHPNSANYISAIGASRGLHADFGSGVWPPGSNSPIGIPYVDVPGSQPLVPVTFIWWPEQSDDGPYPIPPDAPVEGGPDADGDRHVIVLDRDNCVLYEMYYAFPQGGGSWEAGNGAVYDLSSHDLRPDGWTSADAAGLPILPGLVRYDEVASGEIRHAIRFTAPQTQATHLWPARHDASSLTGSNYPPMGLRLRLRADYDISGFSPEIQVILQAFKTYGLILADNGSAWYISGVPDARWDNDMLHEWDGITGANFEVVDTSSLMIDPNSGQAAQP